MGDRSRITPRNAKFTVLADIPKSPVGRISNLLDALRIDDIEVEDFRAAPEIAQDIARDLQAHSLVAQE